MSITKKKINKEVLLNALKEKHTWTEIAKKIGYSRQGAYVVVATMFKEIMQSGKIRDIKKLIK